DLVGPALLALVVLAAGKTTQNEQEKSDRQAHLWVCGTQPGGLAARFNPRGPVMVRAHLIPGSNPRMERIIFCMPPLLIIFIIFCICSNWLSKRLTSCTGTPASAATRRWRDALISSGRARSAGVIALMMPIVRLITFSSTLAL